MTMSTTDKSAQAQIVVQWGDDPFVVTVTHHDTTTAGLLSGPRNTWRWDIRSTTDAAEWLPVRAWSGTDLSSALDVGDPDPIAALCSLGSFLGAYSDAWLRGGPGSENRDLFDASLPYDLAYDIDKAIMLEFPEEDAR
jgi:hypothetical protein